MAAENIYYAPMKLQSAFLFSMCALTLAAHAQPVFVEGVSLDGGWYDCNKTTKWNWKDVANTKPTGYVDFQDGGDWVINDGAMCWAHAASNILQWWQDGQASALPAVVPNGASNTAVPYYSGVPNKVGTHRIDAPLYVQQLAIFKAIGKNWANTGGKSVQAYNWYFNGGKLDAYPGTLLNADSGGYFKDLGLVMNPESYTSPLFTTFTFNDSFTRDVIIDTLTGYIDSNYGTTLSVSGHAITMWGYEMSNDEFFVYLTDSDDFRHALFKQKVIFSDNKWAYLTACDGDTAVYTDTQTASFNKVEQTFQGVVLYEAQAFMGPTLLSVPEPTTATLSLLALTALLARRRRKA